MRNLFFGNLANIHFSGKWIVSAAPPGHADSEYVIGLALKCPQFECIEGQTDRHIFALYYINSINRFLKKCSKLILVVNCLIFWERMLFKNEKCAIFLP